MDLNVIKSACKRAIERPKAPLKGIGSRWDIDSHLVYWECRHKEAEDQDNDADTAGQGFMSKEEVHPPKVPAKGDAMKDNHERSDKSWNDTMPIEE